MICLGTFGGVEKAGDLRANRQVFSVYELIDEVFDVFI